MCLSSVPHGEVMPPRVPRPGERLFEFVRASDKAPMSCELRFHGESYGWEAQFSSAASSATATAHS